MFGTRRFPVIFIEVRCWTLLSCWYNNRTHFTMLYQSPVTLHGHCKTRGDNCWVLYDDRFLSLFEMLQITAILPLRTLWFFQGHISMGCSVICLLIFSVSRVFPWRNESFSGSDCLQVESFETRLLNTRMEILRSCRKF